MGKLRLFYDTLSQPSRALTLFFMTNRIPYDAVAVNLSKGEHLQSDFEKLNPFKKVPVLEHNGFVLTESVAILRYICRELNVPDHWYPQDSQLQARVDEYLEWQHLNTRLFCAMYFQYKVLRPVMSGKPADEKLVKFYYNGMQVVLDQLCNVWLKDRNYLCGDKISIADLLGLCELDQPRMAGYDPGKDRPILKAYMERVRSDLEPHYSVVMERVNKFITKYSDSHSLTAKL
ncbi:glutathione S-transferase theta-1-like [Macrosteles quadrilineatus]|uniref:glutathione S-transferase theta-1-like n=1 Tax=Macrosteles quadrilineatus TaxID=74068 RepID=UPI0023E303A5|nr:glutathione S-transferase theta-1-like [Macrosteles quadrilineatus]